MPAYPGNKAPLPKSASQKPRSRATNVKQQAKMPGTGGKRMDIFSTARTATPKSDPKPLRSGN